MTAPLQCDFGWVIVYNDSDDFTPHCPLMATTTLVIDDDEGDKPRTRAHLCSEHFLLVTNNLTIGGPLPDDNP